MHTNPASACLRFPDRKRTCLPPQPRLNAFRVTAGDCLLLFKLLEKLLTHSHLLGKFLNVESTAGPRDTHRCCPRCSPQNVPPPGFARTLLALAESVHAEAASRNCEGRGASHGARRRRRKGRCQQHRQHQHQCCTHHRVPGEHTKDSRSIIRTFSPKDMLMSCIHHSWPRSSLCSLIAPIGVLCVLLPSAVVSFAPSSTLSSARFPVPSACRSCLIAHCRGAAACPRRPHAGNCLPQDGAAAIAGTAHLHGPS